MQAAFHTKNIGSVMLRPGGLAEIFIEKYRKMISKNSSETLYLTSR